MNSLKTRLSRHLTKGHKSRRWHIDYFLSRPG
ncbi:MAG: DUF123 domain-containing protein [Deltaproteobacteria bacterium]|nr:DUF123 domain-containing protein [Deltaproteobacteria bacterium]